MSSTDEEKVVDAVRPQRRLVEVDRHVDERRVDQCQHDELVRSGVMRQRLNELLARTASSESYYSAAAEWFIRHHLVDDVDAEDDEECQSTGASTGQRHGEERRRGGGGERLVLMPMATVTMASNPASTILTHIAR